MRKNNITKFACLFAAVLIIYSCGGVKKMVDKKDQVKFTVTPDPLEMHAGEVALDLSVSFPEKYFHKKATLEATPVLKYDGGETAYEATILQGESVEGNNKVIPFDGGSYTYSGKIAYSDAMMMSDLEMRFSAKVKDKSVPFPAIKIADGVIATAGLVKNTPQAILFGDNFQRTIEKSVDADIHYVINKYDVRPAELKQDDIKALVAALKEVQANERKEFKGMEISAYASPDGALDLNEKLSVNRQGSAKKYADDQLKKAKISATEELYKLMSTAEDWDGFKKLVEASDLEDKELILRVLSMYQDPEVREREIKNMAKTFEVLAEKILPQLRRSMMKAKVMVTGYTDEELVALATSNPDTLDVEEMLYSATLLDNVDAKLAVYQAASAKYPQCFRSKNNEGCMLLEKGDQAGAKAAFEAAKALKDDDIIKNNLGVIAMLEGDMETAEEYFTAAIGAGPKVSANLGIINIKKADYETAVNNFGSMCDFNAGLAKLLNGDYEASMKTLECVENPDALVDYLKAVNGARTEREEVVMNNLRTAVGKDAGLKAYAKKDIEFRKYFENETFKSIVQ
ncbi:MAG: hypothetical protein JXB49_10665 [Bacteroidales bacterium]|nr:hypothetical protein [Bacteroidales bacterium]